MQPARKSRLKWSALTFAPSLLSVGVAALYFAEGQKDDGVAISIFAAAFAASGITTLNSYRSGYWRGRVEEAEEEPETHMLKHLTGWQPSPWDDGRW